MLSELFLAAVTPHLHPLRLRGRFQMCNTASGRLAMDDPNLQSIPRPAVFGAADGSCSQGTKLDSNMRKAFVAPPGWVHAQCPGLHTRKHEGVILKQRHGISW